MGFNVPGLPYPSESLYIGGALRSPSANRTFDSINPSDGQVLASYTAASESDIDTAIASAEKAFPAWTKTPVVERARILLKVAELLRKYNDELALMETLDTGKAISETKTADIATGADVTEFYANLVAGGHLNAESFDIREDVWSYTDKESLGVCVGIGAWNYPLQIALWKAAPCLAAGNTMVYKASEYTPIHATVMASLLSEAGVPPGVFNIVQGDGSAGAYLTSHPKIAKVSFTGQVPTGQKVARTAAEGMKYVTVELGGKSPLLVLEDADLDQAVDGAMMANFLSNGQICTNGTRVFVPESLKATFEERLLEKMKYIRIGDPQDDKTNFGPLSSAVHYEKVTGYIKHAIDIDRARLLHGDLEKPGVPRELQGGYWIKPFVFTDCTDDMKIVKDEIFGPVMSILPYKTVDELIRRANDTITGLAAGVFTKDLKQARKIVKSLQAGTTWVNTWGESPAAMSVGGFKMSGMGVENGKRGLDSWYRTKSTVVDMSGQIETAFARL